MNQNEVDADNGGETLPSFRFYERKFPKENDLVMARVQQFSDFCVLVELLEYDGIVGSLQFSELSNKRLRQTPHKLLKIGKQDVLQVLKVDEKKRLCRFVKKISYFCGPK